MLDLFMMTKVDSVIREGSVVKGVITAGGKKFKAKIVINATEYGDVIPKTGTRYRVGNINSDQIDSPSFDIDAVEYQNACIQSITYTAIIKKYPNGIPENLRIKAKPPGYSEEIEQFFKSLVTEKGSSTGGLWHDGVFSWGRHAAYRGMPNRNSDAPDVSAGNKDDWLKISKTGINFANDYPWLKDYIKELFYKIPDDYPLSAKYLLDESYRRQINCEGKLRTLQFIYYVQNELNMPWSVATEEGYDGIYNRKRSDCKNIPDYREDLKTIEKYMPVVPYVRESIRMIGLHTLTAKEIKRIGYPEEDVGPFRAKTHFNDSVIAIGDYAVDFHGGDRGVNFELHLGETKKNKPKWRYGPFHIPFESVIPETVDGFIAAEKNISVTRMASAAIRLQPVTMRIGQAVGIIAALAVKNNVPPRRVNPIAVQWNLLEMGVPLLIINNIPKTGYLEYADVSKEHSLWKYIQMAGLRGLLEGVENGRFGVDDAATKIQTINSFAKLYELQIEKPPGQNPQPEGWISRFHRKLHKNLLASYLRIKTIFDESSPEVSRGEFARFLTFWLGIDPSEEKWPTRFYDVPEDHKYYQSIQTVYKKGLMAGLGTQTNGNVVFLPDKIMTRGEMAVEFTTIILKWNNIHY